MFSKNSSANPMPKQSCAFEDGMMASIVCPKIFMQHILTIFDENTHIYERSAKGKYPRYFH